MKNVASNATILVTSIYCLLLFTNASSKEIYEFLPRSVSVYGDGLESGQVIQMPLIASPVLLHFSANVTKGCSWSNVTLFLRHGGLPIVNMRNASYPNSTWVYEGIDVEENFMSDGLQHSVIILPQRSASVLYGVVFVYDDVNQITQQGLTRSCTTLFWGRAEVLSAQNAITNVDDTFEYNSTVSVAAVELVRKSYVQPLTVKWVQDHEDNGNLTNYTEFPVELSTSDPAVFLTWVVEAPLDIGGTLQIELKLAKDSPNVTVYGCLTYGYDDCNNGTSVQVDNTSKDKREKLLVPYPLAGQWFLSLSASCEGLNKSVCDRNVTVTTQVGLWPCQEGSCGSHGRCLQYFSSGIVYATCVCKSGFAGWACSDDSEALSNTILLTSVLVLTLSNLFFIPAIVLAFRRGFYPQCLMYFATMFFSSFYHACDQPEFSYCLMPYSLLQFGDFYAALTSVWLTAIIVAQPVVKDSVLTTIYLFGTVAIAMAVHYNATSLASFIIPIVFGILLIAVCWVHHTYRRKVCFPGRTYILKAVFPCLVFAIMGVICFAFLETEDNYFYVHSIWHISIALAIVFVIPTAERDLDSIRENAFESD